MSNGQTQFHVSGTCKSRHCAMIKKKCCECAMMEMAYIPDTVHPPGNTIKMEAMETTHELFKRCRKCYDHVAAPQPGRKLPPYYLLHYYMLKSISPKQWQPLTDTYNCMICWHHSSGCGRWFMVNNISLRVTSLAFAFNIGHTKIHWIYNWLTQGFQKSLTIFHEEIEANLANTHAKIALCNLLHYVNDLLIIKLVTLAVLKRTLCSIIGGKRNSN